MGAPQANANPSWAVGLHNLGAQTIETAVVTAESFKLFAQVSRELFRFPWRWQEIVQHIATMGVGSLPVITLATTFAGIVITNELVWHMELALKSADMMPGFIGQFILREIGTVIPGALMVSKVGASTTAEIGTMKVTEQIEALKLLGIDPIRYLVFPRFIASIVSMVCLTFVAITVTLGCAMGVAVLSHGFLVSEYLNHLSHFITLTDLACAASKGTVFGAIIPVISCAYGFRCKGGAEGVGTATTNSVVHSTVALITWDFVLTYVFSLFL